MGWWHGLKGYAKWKAAMARGEVRPEPERAIVAGMCAACTRMKMYAAIEVLGFEVWPAMGYCGKPTVETEETCGCIVLREVKPRAGGAGMDGIVHATVNGRPVTACGKTECSGEMCPSREW